MFEVVEEKARLSEGQKTRLRTVAQMLNMTEYAWATNSYLRHVIFEAEERLGSGGAKVAGNGLAPAIVRLGRKVLIDLDEFDLWIEQHRMKTERPVSLQDALLRRTGYHRVE